MSTGATIVVNNNEAPILIVMQADTNDNTEVIIEPSCMESIAANTTSSSTATTSRTPPRHSHLTSSSSSSSSLAHDPISTPIASAKRPRGGVVVSAASTAAAGPGSSASSIATTTTTTTSSRIGIISTSTTTTPDHRLSSTSSSTNRSSPSPMHTVKPVHREALEEEIQDIFSPVAHFLHHESIHTTNTSGNTSEDEDDSIAQPPIGEDDEFNPWTFIQTLPPYETLLPNPVALPPLDAGSILQHHHQQQQHRNHHHSHHKINLHNIKTLVLDLDETLVHCSVDAPASTAPPADLTFPVMFHGNHYTVHVKLRPYLQEFLESVSTKFEVIVFTASQKVYADALLNLIDPEGKYIHHRLFRESCLQVEGNFLKDLNVLGRPLEKTLLVDNSPHAFGYQVDNGIPIESWFDDPNDRELRKLEKFLLKLLPEPDVRPIIRRKFQSSKLVRDS